MDLVRRSGPALVVHLPVRATRLLGARLCDQVGPGLSLGGPVGALALLTPCRTPDGPTMGIKGPLVRGAAGELIPVLGGQCLGIDRDMTENREGVEAAIGPKLGTGPRPVVERVPVRIAYRGQQPGKLLLAHPYLAFLPRAQRMPAHRTLKVQHGGVFQLLQTFQDGPGRGYGRIVVR